MSKDSHPLWDLILVGVCSTIIAVALFYLIATIGLGWWT